MVEPCGRPSISDCPDFRNDLGWFGLDKPYYIPESNISMAEIKIPRTKYTEYIEKYEVKLPYYFQEFGSLFGKIAEDYTVTFIVDQSDEDSDAYIIRKHDSSVYYSHLIPEYFKDERYFCTAELFNEALEKAKQLLQ